MPYKASAPGSLMLLGEHAVLHGKQALVCAVDQRITVTLTPRDDDRIEIESDLFGNYSARLFCNESDKDESKNPFRFILATLNHFPLPTGCHLHIQSDFSDQIGLGSSAAVTAATLVAVNAWLNQAASSQTLIQQGRAIIRQVQGVGSGADMAAAVLGGLVGYQAEPLLAEKFSEVLDLTVVYSGSKMPTVDVIHQVQSHFSSHPILFQRLMDSIGQCAVDGISCVRNKAWSQLGKIMTIQQGLMEALGVSSPKLSGIIQALSQAAGIQGAKISGSGLGDCVVGLGKSLNHLGAPCDGVERIPVNMTLQGVHCEKI